MTTAEGRLIMDEPAAEPKPAGGAKRSDDVLRRAALVLVSLDDRQAAELLSKMSPKQVEAVTAAIENLHEIDPAEQADALREFYDRMGIDRRRVEEPAPPRNIPEERELPGDLRDWPAEMLRMAFDPNQADDWALALADSEHGQIRRVLKTLSMRDRRLLAEADGRRGPWKLHQPHEARERIRARFDRSRVS